MRFKLALAALAVLGGTAFSIPTTSAMPVAPLGQSNVANVETVAMVCGPRGCVRTRPVYRRPVYRRPGYRRGVVVVRRPYARRYYRRY